MQILRVKGKRLAPRDAHPWFKANPEEWVRLNAGERVNVPQEECESVLDLYGDSVTTANQVEPVKEEKTVVKKKSI